MCIDCYMTSKAGGQSQPWRPNQIHLTPRWWIRGSFGRWSNILPKRRRGEGNPPPWIMLRLGGIGFQLEFTPFWWGDIRWFKGPNKTDRATALKLGNFIISWG